MEKNPPDRFEDGRLVFKPMEDSDIPQGESIEMDDLTDKLRKKKSKMGKE